MPRLALLLSLPVIAFAGLVSPAAAKVRTGPSGTAFYKPPHKLPGKTHGDLLGTFMPLDATVDTHVRANEIAVT